MIELGFIIALIVVAALVGLRGAIQELHGASKPTRAGWVYFLSTAGGELEEPPAPIKIGMSHRDPLRYRLPEIETMSPKPLILLYVIEAENPEAAERGIHRELASSRLHGEWFERDSVMSFISHLKGEW